MNLLKTISFCFILSFFCSAAFAQNIPIFQYNKKAVVKPGTEKYVQRLVKNFAGKDSTVTDTIKPDTFKRYSIFKNNIGVDSLNKYLYNQNTYKPKQLIKINQQFGV